MSKKALIVLNFVPKIRQIADVGWGDELTNWWVEIVEGSAKAFRPRDVAV